jgi:hypothetical protein
MPQSTGQEAAWDLDEYGKEWMAVAEEVVNQLMANPEIEKIKQKVRSQGHVEFEDRDQFINLVNKIKYDVIYKRFGEEGTDNYNMFVKVWKRWHEQRSTTLPKPQNMFEDNIYHLLFGSTPNPDSFLKDFDVNKDL